MTAMTDPSPAAVALRAREIVSAFLSKWAEIEPAINNAFALQHVRGMPYSGPTIEAELADLKTLDAALAELAAVPGENELVKALEFYADAARWQMNSSGVTSALDDRGFRAREALAVTPVRDPALSTPATPTAVTDARDAALEEAARVAEYRGPFGDAAYQTPPAIAAAIRALRSSASDHAG